MGFLDYLLYPWGPFACSCRTCGRWLPAENLICEHCWSILETQFFSSEHCEHPLLPGVSLRYLIEWLPGESDFVSVLFRALKGRRASGSWRKFANAFLARHSGALLAAEFFAENPSFIRLLPVPSHSSQVDHAFLFAQALGQALGFKLKQDESIEAGPVRQNQKTQTRSERLARLEARVCSLENEALRTAPPLYRSYLLVDDILTTGATTAELARSLGWPWEKIPADERPSLEVWVLASRSRLAP